MMMKKLIFTLSLIFPLFLFGQVDLFEESQKIQASDKSNDDEFGGNVSISGDYAIVGAHKEDTGGDLAGAAYIFERNMSGLWEEKQKIQASDKSENDEFGFSVAISGEYLVVGAPHEGLHTGAVYVFERNMSGLWEEKQKIQASDISNYDIFGHDVAISGENFIVGVPNKQINAPAEGVVYLFHRNLTGVWEETQKIQASDKEYDDNFGFSVTISNDFFVVGARNEDTGGVNAGAAYIFKPNLSGVWQETQKIQASDKQEDDLFGSAVTISDDFIIVGAPEEGGNKAGAVYIYQYNGTNNWEEIQKVQASDNTSNNEFGTSVSIFEDVFIVGSIIDGGFAGAAYVFKYNATDLWQETQKLQAIDLDLGDEYAVSLAISNDDILIGARKENQLGAAYFYQNVHYEISYNNGSWSGGSGLAGKPNSSDINKSMAILNGDANVDNKLSLKNIRIVNGATLTLNTTASLELSQTSFIDSQEGLILQADQTGTANIMDEGIIYTNDGSVKVACYFDQSSDPGYHYIGSPIENHETFTDMTDLYGYRESDLMWLHHQDPIDGFSSFDNAKGYAIRYNASIAKNFIGAIHTGDYSIALTANNSGESTFNGFNLLGNPYPSAISSSALVAANSSLIGNNIYFWNGVDYAVYNTALASGTAGAIGAVPNGNIALGQGFLVEATANGVLKFNHAMRSGDSAVYYKKEAIAQLRLKVTTNTNQSDLLLVQHHLAHKGFDQYDAKHLESNVALSLTALSDKKAYDIQAVPEFNKHTFDLQLQTTQSNEITFNLQEVFNLEQQNVFLEDTSNGRIINLSKEAYTTQLGKGDHKERFKLRIIKSEDTNDYMFWVNQSGINIYYNNQQLKGTVTLVTMDGKIIETTQKNSLSTWNELSTGIYLISFENEEHRVVKKIFKD